MTFPSSPTCTHRYVLSYAAMLQLPREYEYVLTEPGGAELVRIFVATASRLPSNDGNSDSGNPGGMWRIASRAIAARPSLSAADHAFGSNGRASNGSSIRITNRAIKTTQAKTNTAKVARNRRFRIGRPHLDRFFFSAFRSSREYPSPCREVALSHHPVFFVLSPFRVFVICT
jgi:hypothetical protein